MSDILIGPLVLETAEIKESLPLTMPCHELDVSASPCDETPSTLDAEEDGKDNQPLSSLSHHSLSVRFNINAPDSSAISSATPPAIQSRPGKAFLDAKPGAKTSSSGQGQLLAKRRRSLANLSGLNKRPRLSINMNCRPPTPFPPPRGQSWQPSPPIHEGFMVDLETQWHTAQSGSGDSTSTSGTNLSTIVRSEGSAKVSAEDLLSLTALLKNHIERTVVEVKDFIKTIPVDTTTEIIRLDLQQGQMGVVLEQLDASIIEADRQAYAHCNGAARKDVINEVMAVLQGFIS